MLCSAPQARQNLPSERRQGQPGPSQGSAREGGWPCRSDGAGSPVAAGRSGLVFSGYSCQVERGTLHSRALALVDVQRIVLTGARPAVGWPRRLRARQLFVLVLPRHR